MGINTRAVQPQARYQRPNEKYDEVEADRIHKENKQFVKLQRLKENQKSHRVLGEDYPSAEYGDVGGSSPRHRMGLPPR